MTGHQLPQDKEGDKLPPNPSFFSWLNSQTHLYIGQIVGLVSIASLIFALFYYSNPHSNGAKDLSPQRIQVILFWGNIIFLVAAIAKMIYIMTKSSSDEHNVGSLLKSVFNEPHADNRLSKNIYQKQEKAQEDFKKYFLLFWVAMLALYVAFVMFKTESQKEITIYNKDPTHREGVTFKNNFLSIFKGNAKSLTIKEFKKNISFYNTPVRICHVEKCTTKLG